MTINAYPLQWPAGWPRLDSWRRKAARFATKGRGYGDRELTVFDGVGRVLAQLESMRISRDDVVVSTNVPTRLDGLPRSDARAPSDPGAAVYWRHNGETRCMAIDRYTRVADNLAAIAATLDAMRAIERHGGAEILNRAFTGFTALPGPDAEHWTAVLGVAASASRGDIEDAYRRLRSSTHPDRGGSSEAFDRVQRAYAQAVGA